MIRSIVIGSLTVALAACNPGWPVAPSPLEPPPVDAGPYPDEDVIGVELGEPCAVAASKLWACGCPEAKRVLGESFTRFCRTHKAAIDVECIVGAQSCGELPRRCHVRCVRGSR